MVYGADELLALAVAYSKASGKPLSVVGKLACGNDRIFPRLREGKGCSVKSAEIAGRWFNQHWHETGAPWPLGSRAA